MLTPARRRRLFDVGLALLPGDLAPASGALTELGLRDRTQVAVLGYESGLLRVGEQ